ncbi:SUKH-4 family immunity protein [Streptomyces sp. MOE7]|uniref:SUKH-4 family immunity protein n=1 Tax=Streptomyces sp. MOE7 TaxID=1961713 RepID=UPI0011E4CF85|nr:SUKH-4 family immunity protein [Streptomyces sp. MOE7]
MARILAWWRDGRREPVAELVGAPESGRTQVLRQVHEALPTGVWVDATGLTAEEVLQRVLAAAEVAPPPDRRAGWRGALRKADLGDRPVFLANAHRAGRTRASAQPDRVVRTLARDLAVSARTKVVVEADPPARTPPRRGLLALHLLSDATAEELPVPLAVRALALAELPRTPLAVWSELAAAVGAELPDRAALPEFVRRFPDLLDLDGEWVSFREERVARRLRRDFDAAQLRSAGARLVDRLSARPPSAGGFPDREGPVGAYLTHALPLHALHAGRLDDVQRAGEVLAHLDQVALLDAANCASPHALDRRTPAGDAANLWLSGVDSLPQNTWAAWLHLMSTVRGDTEVADGIARSGLHLPWKVRWAHWRPPGGWDLSYLEPGPQLALSDVTDDVSEDVPGAAGRRVVAGQGAWDRRVRLWDAATGEQLGGPWSDGVPRPGQAEPLWPPDRDPQLTPPWVQLTSYGIAPELISDTLRLAGPDGLVVVAGPGGVFAVEPADPGGFEGLGDVHGEPFLAPYGRVDGGTDWPTPDPAVLDALFGPGAVRRMAADALPAGLADEDARRLLTETGLPAFRGAEMRLVALDEEPLAELSADEVWEFTEDDDVPESAGRGAYYRLGVWGGHRLVLDGEGGGVHVVPGEDDPGYEQPLVASSLRTFVAMLQGYVFGRCLLPMAVSPAERERVRDLIALDLEAIDEEGAESAAWTDVLDDETD